MQFCLLAMLSLWVIQMSLFIGLKGRVGCAGFCRWPWDHTRERNWRGSMALGPLPAEAQHLPLKFPQGLLPDDQGNGVKAQGKMPVCET